jgi:hypothetical protein
MIKVIRLAVLLSVAFLSTVLSLGAGTTQTLLYVDGTNGSDSNNGLTPATAKATLTGALSLCPSTGCTIYQLTPTTENNGVVLSKPNTRIYFAPGKTTINGGVGGVGVQLLANDDQLFGFGDDSDQNRTTGTILSVTTTGFAIAAGQGGLSPTAVIFRPVVDRIFIQDAASCVVFYASWHGEITRSHCLGSGTGASGSVGFLLEDIAHPAGSYWNEINDNTVRAVDYGVELYSSAAQGTNQNRVSYTSGDTNIVGIEIAAGANGEATWNLTTGNDLAAENPGTDCTSGSWIGQYLTGNVYANTSINDAYEPNGCAGTYGIRMDSLVTNEIIINPNVEGTQFLIYDATTAKDTIVLGNRTSTTKTSSLVNLPAIVYNGVVYSSLSNFPSNGTVVYCSDCQITNPCASGGHGAIAKRLSGIWVCN